MHPSQLVNEAAMLIGLVLRFEHPADAVVAHHFRAQKSFGPRDRATLAEAAYAVLRYKPRFEHFAQTGNGPAARRLALLGLAQATSLPMDMAATPQERAWLAHCLEQPLDKLPVPLRHCLPTWLANALHDQYGAAMLPLAESLLAPAPLDLRVNVLKAKRDGTDGVLSKLKLADILCAPTAYSPTGIRLVGKPNAQKWEAYEQGEIEVQDEGSQLLASLVQAKRGEMIADFCAGAGGKTLALGAAMRNTGRLYAFDVAAKRLDQLKPRLARSGLSNVNAVAIDHENDSRVKRLAGKMDRVLVDAPCSGLGTMRRNPDLKWRQTPQTVAEYRQLQSNILQAAARLVKPGGRLVYATCSLLKAENQDIATQFAANNLEFKSQDMSDWAQSIKLEGATYNAEGMHCVAMRSDLHQTDGFFAVVFEREIHHA